MELVDIDSWASSNIQTVTITQYVTDANGAPLRYKINVRQFTPRQGDALKRTWRCNGVEESYPCEPYGIADMAESAAVLRRFVDDTLWDAIKFHIDEDNTLLRSTYRMAYKYSRSAKVGVSFDFRRFHRTDSNLCLCPISAK